MSRKRLVALMRMKMRASFSDPENLCHSRLAEGVYSMISNSEGNRDIKTTEDCYVEDNGRNSVQRDFDLVRASMHSATFVDKSETVDTILSDFSKGYFKLSLKNRRNILLILSRDYDLDRSKVRELMRQYIELDIPAANGPQFVNVEDADMFSSFYRAERSLRQTLKPAYDSLFERLNTHPGGLKLLSILRADILSILMEENIASLRAVDSYLKEKLVTWLSPAALELHLITWDDPASLLEKIVAYEAVHPISSLLDLKRRLGVGRRCFAYFHPAIPGEPLIFIEVALLKNVAQTIEEVLWDNPPTLECDASCALFYSISSTQSGLAGINLGKFLIKRVIELVRKEMAHIFTFATLSPIPGYMQWLMGKLESQLKLVETESVAIPCSSQGAPGSTFLEDILLAEEEQALLDPSLGIIAGSKGIEIMLNILRSEKHEWTTSAKLMSALRAPLIRLCIRYLIQEKKRGKALDSVANFHLHNGAMISRVNWMADLSNKGFSQSAGIMVNYVYRVEEIEENVKAYICKGTISHSPQLFSLSSM